MANNVNVWSNVQVAVQTVLAEEKTISAITKASPAVATIATSGYVVGDVLLLQIEGMRQLNNRVVRVAAVTSDAVTLEGIDATLWGSFTTGTAQKITFGAEASTLQDVNASGGEAAGILIATIHDDQDYEVPGNRTPQAMTFGSLWMPGDPALMALAGFDQLKSPCALEVRFATGDAVYFLCYPSASLAPQGSAGGPVTTPVSFRIRGRITAYAS